MARAIMIQGCTSSAGKSYLTAALCRILANEGVRVAPFKAQNMSNNAGVTPAGLEMGRAQLVQAQAARVVPDVRMNPVLLKPEADTRSQVVLLGRASPELTTLGWRERKPHLWPHVQTALHSLMADYDVVVIEGAGSPAEINLRGSDIVNMRVAREAGAAVLLAADIDRGGAFAHLLGTWHCLTPVERLLLKGFILNRFRGDAGLLSPAPEWLEEQTGVPTVGVVPMLDIPLPEEDGFWAEKTHASGGNGFVAIARLPRVSNLDEFAPLGTLARWVTTPAELEGARATILPGSKSSAADLGWLRACGLAAAVSRAAQAGVPVLGICGGLQMLGRTLSDPHGIEGGREEVPGLGLLDLATTFAVDKTTRLTTCTDAETGLHLSGYEIHHGQTRTGPGVQELAPELLWRAGNVRGTYLHGLLENPAYLERFLDWAGLTQPEALESLDARLDAIAVRVRAGLNWDFVRGLL
ncbi:cobyric acid synthase [Deinococcus alpinitundrae]|uniref:cobyric acid synthase n=1 Tax=Deinococcus alpinitundrae TaxID=468913 RepID=UPI001ED8C25A|nr:cobyric acid synthase [Deinococcus alpinitundrae]